MDPEVWRWLWLILALVLAAGEITTAGFFLLPFSLGAIAASVLAFPSLGFEWQLLGFALVSAGSFAAMRPLAAKLDREGITVGIGSRRLIGEPAVAITDIDPDDGGMIRVQREEWRADSDDGRLILAGSSITVVEVKGTRCIVRLDAIGPGDS